ncbi:MAG: bifunctional serine/threonine-protein kinase/formylglycine-generating enzyme family protein [Isosphaeraceae bacterium]|nr:bifunctional serine/threonine-protein kinase/formylglycine-generating enzyme family protein [Isosphaeraceae bacterium]
MPDPSKQPPNPDEFRTYVMPPGEAGRDSGAIAEKTPPGTHPTAEPTPYVSPTDRFAPTPSGSKTPSGGVSSQFAIPHGAISPGTELFGDYVVESKLGEGGMGSVWKVFNKDLGTSTALKLIVDTNFTSDARERFRREAQLMALVRHENAVHVYRSKVQPDFAFIEMEFLKGRSIDRLLERGRPQDLPWIARIVDQLCSVLEYAHEHVKDNQGRPIKIVHRDLKPSNLMILDDATKGPYFLKVLDFGIAKKVELQASTDGAEFRTGTGGALFTLPYASPEQIGGRRDITEKADVYSVGVMLYEFLTGYRPFEEPGLIYKQISSPPPSFQERNPRVPAMPAIESLVMRCLDKDPTRRPSARGLVEEFFAVLPPDLAIPQAATGRSSTSRMRVPGTSRGPSTSDLRAASLQTQRVSEAAGSAERTEVGTSSRPSWKTEPQRPVKSSKTPRESRAAGPSSPPIGIILGAIAVLMIAVAFWIFSLPGKDTSKQGGGTPPLVPDPPAGKTSAPSTLLPEGYEEVAENKARVDGYPQVIQRRGTNIRFIYLPTRSFKLGADRDHEAFASRVAGDDPNRPFDVEKDDRRDDIPQRDVMVTHFYIQETEVTNGEIAAFMRKQGRRERDLWERGFNANPRALEGKPAVNVSKEIARAYAKSVGGDLPSELQWEFAARSADSRYRPYVWRKANHIPALVRDDLNIEVALVSGRPIDAIRGPNESRHDQTEDGVIGMMGNVREWCLDVWAPYPADDAANKLLPQRDPVNETPFGVPRSVIRGASYRSFADRCQTTWPRRLMEENDSATLSQLKENGCADDIGFRVVLPLPEPQADAAAR